MNSGSDKNRLSLKEYRKLQEARRLPYGRITWIQGLFGESPRINHWNLKSQVLSNRWFLYVWKPSVVYLRRWQLRFQEELEPLLTPVIEEVLSIGWRYLTKVQYNNLALLRKLLVQIRQYDWAGLAQWSARVYLSLRPLETLFFTLLAYPGGIKSLCRCFDILAKANPDAHYRLDKAKDLTKALMMSHPDPSLYHLIQGISALKLRRLLALEDLCEVPEGPLVSPWEYDADDSVQGQITAEMVKLEKTLTHLLMLKKDFEALAKFLPPAKTIYQDEIFSFLRQYTDQSGELSESSPILLLSQLFLKQYLGLYGLILSGKISFERKSPPEDVLDSLIFEQDLGSLLKLHDHLEELIFSSSLMTALRWQQLMGGKESPREGEAPTLDAVRALSECIVTIGKKMVQVLDTPGFQSCQERAIKAKTPFEGQSALDMAGSLCRISFILGLYIGNPGLHSLVKELEQVRKEISIHWADFERMADPERIEQLKKDWNPGGDNS